MFCARPGEAGGGRWWLAVAGMMMAVAARAGAEVLYAETAPMDFFTWAEDLKPGYIIMEKTTSDRVCFCKKPSVLGLPEGLLANITTTTTAAATTPTASSSTASFSFSIADITALSLSYKASRESSFDYAFVQTANRIQVNAPLANNVPGAA
ncbi:uncharacterized protein [Panulirus ornatus]|uniref:uncharacterized protein n=1 Tax=Panulirus ornatus TaxID=150431 RepID=UPI003A847907